MRKKLLFLSAAVAMCMMPLSSCSKGDEPRSPEANIKSVDGTEWYNSKAKIKFSNGRYTINCAVPGSGTYSQNGSHITFSGNLIVIDGGGALLKEGEISKYGSTMTVTYTNSSGGNRQTMNLTYKVPVK